MELKDIIKEPVTVTEDTTFKNVLSTMVTKQTNAVLVTDSEGKLSGEVSVSDLMDAIVPEYLDGNSIAAGFATKEMFDEAVRDAADIPVHDFMNTEIEAVRSNDGLMHVAAVALEHKKARIPVVDDENRPVGMVSRRGLKQLLAATLNVTDES